MSGQDQLVNLISNEGDKYEVPLKVARMSNLIQNLSEDVGEDEVEDKDFPCPKVSSAILQKVVDYCTHYQEEEMQKIETPLQGETIEEIVKPAWYAEFCKVDREVLFQLVAAANFMDIKPLLDLTCLAVSVSIKGKSVEELRKIFNLPEPEPLANNDGGDSDDDGDDQDGEDEAME